MVIYLFNFFYLKFGQSGGLREPSASLRHLVRVILSWLLTLTVACYSA